MRQQLESTITTLARCAAAALLAAFMALGVAACDRDEGPLEETAEQTEETAEEAGDAVQDTAEDAGDAVEDTADEAD